MVRKNKLKASTQSLLTKMNLRAIIHSKLQFIAVILITAIAMTLYVGLTSNAKSIDGRVNELYQGSNVADIWTTTSISDDIDMHEIKTIAGPNSKTEGRFMMPAKLKNYTAIALMSDELPTINKPYETNNTETEDFFIVDRKLTDPVTNKSTFIDENGDYILAPISFSISGYQSMLEEMEIGTFDGEKRTMMDALRLCLIDPNSDLLDNPYLEIKVQVTGEMTFAENVQTSQMNTTNFLLSKGLFRNKIHQVISNNLANPTNFDESDPNYELKNYINKTHLVMMSYMIIETLSRDNQFCTLVDPSYDVTKTKEAIQDYFHSKDNDNLLMCTELDMLASNFTIQSDIVQARQLAYIFPVIFFLVAILVVLTTISQIIIKDRIQIGTMKAIGLSNTRIILHYMALGVYIVMIGVALGMIAGPFIIPMIMNKKYDILYTLPSMKYTLAIPEALISTLIVGLVTCLVTFLVVKSTVRLNPAEGMRPKEIKSVKEPKHDKIVSNKALPFKMAFRNIRLNITKSLMVIFGIMGCTALLVCGFGIDDTLNKGVDNDSGLFFTSDGYVSYNTSQSLKEEILKVEGVEGVEEYTYLPATANNGEFTYDTFLSVIEDNSTHFHIDGYELGSDIVITGKVAKQMNLHVGDEISFSCVSHNFKGKIGLVLETFYMHGIFVDGGQAQYKPILDIKTQAWVDFKDGVDHDQAVLNIKEISGVNTAKTRDANIEMVRSYMSSIQLMTLAVKVFAILLAVVVLYNLSLLNFKERMRDIATLKVLGFSKSEIASSLIIESLVLTLVGVGFGLLLGYPLEILVLVVNLTPLVEFLYAVFPMSYFISFVLTIGTTLLVDYLLTFKIKGVKMVESLKSVE